MSDINQVVLGGNLCADPIARGGGTVAALRIASNRHRQNDGEWITETTYIDVSCFGHNASKAIEKLIKGDPITVTGRLETNEYRNSDGEKRSQLRLVASTLNSPVFTAKLRKAFRAVQAESNGDLPTSANTADPVEEQEPEAALVGATEVTDDDIPF